MRTLKKSLAFVLVFALVLSFGIISASASNLDDFTDAGQVGAAYEEAVDLFVGLGIVNGVTPTTLEPEGNYTREQAAKVLTYMMLGGTVADKLKAASAPFDDVAADRWSAGYIAYCANEGILAGYGDGNFGPADELTGYQWAKMLLVAIGYGTSEDYTGSGWEIRVAKDAFKANLFKGDDTAASNDPISREQAILMGFNALFYGEEVTETKTQYILGVDSSTAGTALMNIAGDLYDSIAAAKADVAAAATADSDTYVYGTDYWVDALEVEITTTEDSLADEVFNVKAVDTIDDFGRNITKYTVKGKTKSTAVATPDLTYTTEVTSGTIFSDLGLKDDIDATIYTDGSYNVDIFPVEYNNKNDKVGGNGTLVEVYYDADDEEITIVVVNTYFGEITSVKEATAVKDAYVTVTAGNVQLTGFTSGDIDATGFEEGDYVLYTVAQTGASTFVVKSVALAEKESLKATSYIADKSFVAGGTTYKYSAKLDSAAVADFNTHDIYFDSYGYVINVAGDSTAASYAVLLAAGKSSDGLGGETYNVRLLFTDGTVEVAQSTEDYSTSSLDVIPAGTIVTYTKSASSGKYTLTDATSDDYNNVALDLKSGVSKFTWDSGTFYGNANTVYLVRSISTPYTYTAYTGVANVPSMSGNATGQVVENAQGFAAVVYITGVSATTSESDKVYITGTYDTYNDVDLGTYYVAKAIVDGEPGTVKLGAVPVAGLYEGISYNVDGIGTLGAPSTVNTGTGTTKLTDGVIGIGSEFLSPASNCAVYYISAAPARDGSVSSVSAIKTDTNDTVIYTTNSSGQVTAIYIQVVA